MYKRILCAVEANDEGKMVLAKAHELAELCGAQVFVTNVIPHTLLPKDYQKELQSKVIPKLDSLTKKYNIPKKNIAVKFGKPYEQICTLATKKKIDLILLGTHSKKGVSALIGSTASAVSNHATCDVILIKV